MQSRRMSIVETIANTSLGFVISVLTTQIVLPQYHCPVTMSDNVEITTIFTIISVARGYIVRRFFNWCGQWQMNLARRLVRLNGNLRDEVSSRE